ncbi:hypothetical protein [Kitasatospora sp. NPDC057223]|uniref:hypothetical protein n=1 Tax=Kitasatospora sp. NPDC057223 TaxID=3346055 RepID=UPI00363D491A
MSRDDTTGLRAALLRLGRLPGYVRRPDLARRTGEQGHTYKKGWEVRFTARTEEEIAEIRDLVVAAGFAPARPFFKGHQLIQPVYGMAVVQAYLAARQSAEENAAKAGGPTRGAAVGPAAVRTDVHRTSTRTELRPDGAGPAGHEQDRRATAAGAAVAAAASAATAAARARRQAVEGFPAQAERSTAADRLDRTAQAAQAARAVAQSVARGVSQSAAQGVSHALPQPVSPGAGRPAGSQGEQLPARSS